MRTGSRIGAAEADVPAPVAAHAPAPLAVPGRESAAVAVGDILAAGNRAAAGVLAGRGARALRRTLIGQPSGGSVGDEPGPNVNRLMDLGPVLDRLHILWAVTNDEYGQQVKAFEGKSKTDVVQTADLGPFLSGLRKAREGSVAVPVALRMFGVEIGAPVGPGLANAPADLKVLRAAMTAEGIAGDEAEGSVIAGLAEVKRRVLTGERPLRPVAVSGDPKAFAKALFADNDPGPGTSRLLDDGGWRMWPTLLRPPMRANLTPEQVNEIIGKVRTARAAVPLRGDVTVANPGGGLYHAGLYHTRSKAELRAGVEPDPTNISSEEVARGKTTSNPVPGEAAGPPQADPDRVRIGQLAWKELLTEGSAGSLNAYDSQLLTVGRGFGAKGQQGRDVLKKVFTRDAAARDAMLDVGFALDGSTPLALDLNTKQVVFGEAALHHIEQDRVFGSQFATTFEAPEHVQAMVDAQYSVMRDNTADIPDAQFATVKTWPDASVRFWIHARHFASGLTWAQAVAAAPHGELIKLVGLVIRYAPSVGGARTVYLGEDTRILEWAEGAARALTSTASPAEGSAVNAFVAAPDDAAKKTAVAGLGARFFQTSAGWRKLVL